MKKKQTHEDEKLEKAQQITGEKMPNSSKKKASEIETGKSIVNKKSSRGGDDRKRSGEPTNDQRAAVRIW